VETLSIREARKADVGAAAELIVRTKRLNNEFDPMFTVVDDALARAAKYVSSSVGSKDILFLVAVRGQKLVGVLRAEMRERIFYIPSRDGHITDFYVMPEFRRKALGNEMMGRAVRDLRKMGAQVVTAEVPSQNEIAMRFYHKRDFRPLLQYFAKQP
jgi:ribosomal protein S18 acetylase RimI-like enzyme